MTTLNQELIKLVESNLGAGEQRSRIDESTQLIEEGLVDSIGLMQIVALVEERAGVRIPDEEVSPDNFASVGTIVNLVSRLESEQRKR